MKIAIVTLLLSLAVATCGSMTAQDQPPAATNSAQPGAKDQAQPRGPERTVQILADRLQLTEDQKTKIEPIIADRQQKLRALQSSSMRRMKKARKMKGILKDSDKKINAILTPTQQKQYAELKEELKERIQQRRQNEPAP